MKKPRISMIAAIGATNRVLGTNNDLIWKISDDLKRFKQLTTGHPIIMGRKTYESIGRPLPNRTNIVITHKYDFAPEGVKVVHSLEEAFAEASLVEQEEIFVIGGGDIYTQAIPFADRLYLTLVHEDKDGDIFFPEFFEFTKLITQEDHLDQAPPYTYVILERKEV
jgi:dihydrofolate reductase